MRTVPHCKLWSQALTVAKINPTQTNEDVDELCDVLHLEHPERLRCIPFTEGFCNEVFKVAYDEKEYVVKKYSDLSQLRASLENCVRMQKLLAERSLCPHVIATTEEIIVTEHLSGKVLSEQDMLDNSELMKSLAELISRLHTVKARDENVALIWMWFRLMLARLRERRVVVIDDTSTEEIAQELSRVQCLCEGLDLHLCLCHGDLKPSNIILQHDCDVKLIDIDLCGTNFRGFDTMKLFRTDYASFYDNNLLSFLQLYHQRTSSAMTVAELFFESQLFEPLTWLEAALFFAVLSVDVAKNDGNERNTLLFRDRWAKYKETRWKLACFGRLLSP